MKYIRIYSDGASFNNGKLKPELPMFGAYASIVVNEDKLTEDDGILFQYSDWFEDITNNQAELFGFIKAFYGILAKHKSKEKIHVTCISDSKYLVENIERIPKWKKNGWKSSTGKVKNQDLWEIIDGMISYDPNVEVEFQWQKGHVGKSTKLSENPDAYYNEQCDSIATGKIKECTSKDNTMIDPDTFKNYIDKYSKIFVK